MRPSRSAAARNAAFSLLPDPRRFFLEAWDRGGRLAPYRYQTGGRLRGARAYRDSGIPLAAGILKDLGPLRRCAAAVDIGCGAGRLLAPLALVFQRVVGVEPSPSLRRLARREACRLAGRRVRVLKGNGRDLKGLPSLSADACVFSGSLYALSGEAPVLRYLREARRILRPGGKVWFDLLSPKARPEALPGAVRFSPSRARTLIRRAGLEPVSLRPIWRGEGIAAAARRLLGQRRR